MTADSVSTKEPTNVMTGGSVSKKVLVDVDYQCYDRQFCVLENAL